MFEVFPHLRCSEGAEGLTYEPRSCLLLIASVIITVLTTKESVSKPKSLVCAYYDHLHLRRCRLCQEHATVISSRIVVSSSSSSTIVEVEVVVAVVIVVVVIVVKVVR